MGPFVDFLQHDLFRMHKRCPLNIQDGTNSEETIDDVIQMEL